MADDINNLYYSLHEPGRLDYWRKMAAPRFRVKIILKSLVSLAPTSIVDLGCGSGLLLEEVSKKFGSAQLCGVDLSAQQIEQNTRAYPGTQWAVFDLDRRQPVPETLRHRFDVALCSEVIEHVDNPEILLTHARDMTAPKGLLIMTTQSGPIRETERRVGHKQHFTREKFELLLRKTGWQPLRIWNAGFPFHDLSKWMANRNPEKTMDHFSARAYGPWENFVCATLRALFSLNSTTTGAQLFAIARRS